MNYVACIKSGNKYGPDYVNKLFNMVRRNASSDVNFVCFTDNKNDIDSRIQTFDLPYPGLTGWGNKLALFSGNLPISGTVLFLDLDVVIINNIDDLFKYSPNKFIILQSFAERINRRGFLSYGRRFLNKIKGTSIFNSSIFRFETKNNYMIWEKYLKSKAEIENNFPTDQEWISECVRHNAGIWPYVWCMSYKWEIAGDFDKNQPPFYKPRTKNIPPHCKIIVFHGKPDPEDVMEDSIIRDNYR